MENAGVAKQDFTELVPVRCSRVLDPPFADFPASSRHQVFQEFLPVVHKSVALASLKREKEGEKKGHDEHEGDHQEQSDLEVQTPEGGHLLCGE